VAATLQTPVLARAFLYPLLESLKTDDTSAYRLAAVQEAHYALLAQDLPACLATITECEPLRGIHNFYI
jgi:hypothetical protein